MERIMNTVYIVYRGFKNWEQLIPVAAFTDPLAAAKKADELNTDNTDDTIEYYCDMKGVTLYA